MKEAGAPAVQGGHTFTRDLWLGLTEVTLESGALGRGTQSTGARA